MPQPSHFSEALLHDGLCTSDLAWLPAVPSAHGARTHPADVTRAGRDGWRDGWVETQQLEGWNALDLFSYKHCFKILLFMFFWNQSMFLKPIMKADLRSCCYIQPPWQITRCSEGSTLRTWCAQLTRATGATWRQPRSSAGVCPPRQMAGVV